MKQTKEPSSFTFLHNDLNTSSAALLEGAEEIAVDTEAMGLIHGRDRLCLVQICDKKDNVICVKIELGQTSAPRLQAIMENQAIQKVFHYARFDIAALAYGLDIKVEPIFCTKVANKLGRTYTPRHGLKELIMELVGIELDKQSQSSDWGTTKELNEKQLIYAANDVRYLLSAKSILEDMLEREGRLELAKQCFKCLPVIAELDILKFNQILEH